MINVYFSTTKMSAKTQNDIKEQLGEIDDVQILSYEDERISVRGEKYPTIICITPYTYSPKFIDDALIAIADNPKKFVFLYIKSEYDSFDHLVSYDSSINEYIGLIKTAFSYENEKFCESIYAVKSLLKKVH